MTVGSYTSYLGYLVDGSMARAIKVTYNISLHENKCNVKKKLHHLMCDFVTIINVLRATNCKLQC